MNEPPNPFSLRERNFLVTGGTRGIGLAISLRFARAGARVTANYVRNEESANQLRAIAAAEGLEIGLCRADLTLEKGLAEVVRAIDQSGPGLSGFVHCAATGVHRPLAELTSRHLAWTMDLNVNAFFKLVQLLQPRLAAGATIVALTSWGATRTFPTYALVGASKAALDALSRHLAAELAPAGIRVNLLCPGAVATEVWKAMPGGEARLAESIRRTPAGRLVTPDEVALAAQFLSSDASAGIIGHTLVIDGGAGVLG